MKYFAVKIIVLLLATNFSVIFSYLHVHTTGLRGLRYYRNSVGNSVGNSYYNNRYVINSNLNSAKSVHGSEVGHNHDHNTNSDDDHTISDISNDSYDDDNSDGNSQYKYLDGVSPLEQIRQNNVVYFLRKELKLSEKTITRIILKQSWLMYLKVETNIKPTLEGFRSFGFREKDIRTIVDCVPTVLALNHEWTIPEKLISLRKMFHLNKIGLIKLVTAQPYLITSSVERNLEIADFLSEQMGLLPDEIRQLLLKRPQIALTSISVLTEVWDILTSFYGIPENEARKLCVRYPLVLSKKILLDFKNRVDFFDELNMTPPFDDLQNVIIKFPALLFVDTTIFLRPNLLVLVNELECDSREIFKIISTFPQLLGYNPQYLTKLCRKAIYFLTNLAEYDVNSTRIRDLDTGGADSSLADDDKSYRSANADGYAFGDSKKADGCSLDVGTVDITSKEDIVDESLMVDDLVDMDLIADLVYKDKLEAISGTIKELYNYPSFDGLKLEKSSALSILRAAPWIISYRTERSTRILGCLMATLGLSPVELERCVKMYPRLLSLSVNGKLHTVLRTLTQAAVRNVHYLEDPFLSTNLDADDTCVDPYYCDERFLLHRNNRIRSMVRQLVVRYPLVLGTSMLRITERIDAMDAARASYSEFVTILRRSTRAHNKWLTSQIGEEAVVKLQNKVMKKVVKKKVKVERDVVDVIPKMDDLSDIFEPIEINEEELIVGGWKRHSSTNKKDISDGHNSCLKVSTSFKLTDTVIESTNINEAISDSDGNKVENDGRIDSDSIADTSGRLLHNYPQLYQQQEPTDQHRQIFQPMVPNVNIAINSIYKNPIGNTLSYPYLFPDTVKDIVDKNINIYATVTKDSNQSRDSNINSNTEESFGNRLKAFEDSLSLNMIEPKIETVWTYTNSSDKKTVLNLSTILDIQSFILKRRIKRLEERETTDSNDIEHFQ